MKRRTALVAVSAAAVVLAGCTTTPTPGASSGDGDDATSGRLSFLSPWTQAQTAPMVEGYQASHAGTTVDVTYVAGNENAQQLLATQLSAGNAPDVYYLNPGSGSPTSVGVLAAAGYLRDLSGESWAADVEDPYREFLSHDGSVYAYPSTVFAIGAIYNDGMLAEAGLRVPDTFSDLIAFCGDARAAGTPAFTLGAGATWMNALVPYALASTLVDSVDPGFESGVGSTSDFTGSGWVQALEQYQQMIDAGCFQDDPTGTDGPSTWQLVGQGESFGVVAPGALLSEVQAAAPEGAEFVMAALPATDDPDATTLPVSLSSTLGVNADARDPELALDFVNWLAEPEQLALLASNQVGAVPTIADDAFEAPDSIAVLTELREQDRTTPVPDLSWPNAEVQAALQSGGQAMLLGQQGPADVAAAMQSAAQG